MDVDALQIISVSDGAWHTMPYARKQTCIDQVEMEVDH